MTVSEAYARLWFGDLGESIGASIALDIRKRTGKMPIEATKEDILAAYRNVYGLRKESK